MLLREQEGHQTYRVRHAAVLETGHAATYPSVQVARGALARDVERRPASVGLDEFQAPFLLPWPTGCA